MKQAFGATRAYSDYAAMLADDEIDAVYIASPQQRHCDELWPRLEAGQRMSCARSQ